LIIHKPTPTLGSQNLGPIGSAVLTFGYTQTDKQTNRQKDKLNPCIDVRKKTVSGKVNLTGKFYYKKVGREAYHYCIRCKILKLKCIVDRVDHCDSGSNSQWLYHYRQSRNSKIILLCKYARSGGILPRIPLPTHV